MQNAGMRNARKCELAWATYLAHHVRPGVCTVEQATALRAGPAGGVRRYGDAALGVPPGELAADCQGRRVWTKRLRHAVRLDQALLLAQAAGRQSAAGCRTETAAPPKPLTPSPSPWVQGERGKKGRAPSLCWTLPPVSRPAEIHSGSGVPPLIQRRDASATLPAVDSSAAGCPHRRNAGWRGHVFRQ